MVHFCYVTRPEYTCFDQWLFLSGGLSALPWVWVCLAISVEIQQPRETRM